MKDIPKFWVTQKGEGIDAADHHLPLVVWGCSRESMSTTRGWRYGRE